MTSVGAVYPQNELSGDAAAVRALATGLEAVGCRHLLAYDHLLGVDQSGRTPPYTSPFTEKDPFHDPLVLFAHLAGVTDRLEFATGVLVLPSRQTVLVARQAADVDLLSGGRLRLGVGVGKNHIEYAAMGASFSGRGARQDEQIELLRRLWTDDLVDFAGRFDRIDRAALLPHPDRSIPIWLGGWGEAAHDRAARLGDGFMFFGSIADVSASWTSLRERVARAGRSVADFGGDYIVPVNADPIAVADSVERWRDIGGTHASVVTMGLGLDCAAAHVDYFGRVAARL